MKWSTTKKSIYPIVKKKNVVKVYIMFKDGRPIQILNGYSKKDRQERLEFNVLWFQPHKWKIKYCDIRVIQ